MITKNMSLANIVKEFPGSVDIFNKYKLDYCCGGKVLLQDALVESKIDAEDFMENLNKAQEQDKSNKENRLNTSLYNLSVAELIDFIEEEHHVDERDMLGELAHLVNKILIVHYDSHREELIKVHHLFSDLKKELEEHFVKEEQIVFPMMKDQEKADDKLTSLIQELDDEHLAAGAIIKQLQEVTNNFTPPQGACATYVATYQMLQRLVNDIFLHIYSETAILFERFSTGS